MRLIYPNGLQFRHALLCMTGICCMHLLQLTGLDHVEVLASIPTKVILDEDPWIWHSKWWLPYNDRNYFWDENKSLLRRTQNSCYWIITKIYLVKKTWQLTKQTSLRILQLDIGNNPFQTVSPHCHWQRYYNWNQDCIELFCLVTQ